MTALLLIAAAYAWCCAIGYALGYAADNDGPQGLKIGAQVATAFTLTGLILWGAVAVSAA